MNGPNLTKDDQLAAACLIYTCDASQRLGMPLTESAGSAANRENLRRRFTFSKAELKKYIHSTPGLAEKLLNASLDQRSSAPSAFIEPVGGGYNVGWFDGAKSRARFHSTIENAALDFVLLIWGLPRE